MDVAQRNTGVECSSDERMSQGVRANGLVDAGAAGNAAHDATGAMPVHPLSVWPAKDRSLESFADGQVDRPCGAGREWDGDDLAAHAKDGEGAVATVDAKRVDVGAKCLGDPETVDREQRDQGVLVRRAETSGDQQRANLVAVQTDSVGLLVQPRAPDVNGWGVLEQFLLDGVAVEPGDRAQSPGDSRPGATPGLHVTAETLDVRSPPPGTVGPRASDTMR